MSRERRRHLSGAQFIACPSCDALLEFRRSHAPHIDDSGFESYGLECKECGAALAGIIDPADDALLLTECERQPDAAFPQMGI